MYNIAKSLYTFPISATYVNSYKHSDLENFSLFNDHFELLTLGRMKTSVNFHN